MRYALLLTLSAGLFVGGAAAGSTGAQPTQPAAPADRLSPELELWLERIEARADELETLASEVKYERVQGLLGDRQIRFGELRYHAGPPARFALAFNRLVVDEHIEQRDHAFVFDGRWLAERIGDRRQFIRRELVPEDQVGEDLLRLGEGPFALPLDLDKQTVQERFEASLIESAEDDPPGTVHVRLIPREGLEVDQSQIDIWYDREMLLPVKVYTVNEEDETESTIYLRNLQPGADVSPDSFDTAPPREPGWRTEVVPLEQG